MSPKRTSKKAPSPAATEAHEVAHEEAHEVAHEESHEEAHEESREDPTPNISHESQDGVHAFSESPTHETSTDAMTDLLREIGDMCEAVSSLSAVVKRLEIGLKKSTKLISRVSKASRKKRGGGGGANSDPNAPKRETNLTKKLEITPEMAKFLGTSENEASRTGIVKKVSDYSKEKQLKLDTDKRVIVLDETLANLFGMEVGAKVRFCDVQKHIKHHIISSAQK